MKRLLILFCLLMLGGQPTHAQLIAPARGVDDQIAGAAGENGANNVTGSPYYTAPDYYARTPTPTIVLLPRFASYQQTSERSCGAAAVLMTLAYLGIPASEAELDMEMDIRYLDKRREDGSYGATTASVATALRQRGVMVTSAADTADDGGYSFRTIELFQAFIRKQLHAGLPILVENVEWGGHWMVLIGYDDMGTPQTADDVLVFADSYDTTDHMQDGYLTKSFERFFYAWFDGQVLPPGQRIQQYVGVTARPKTR